MQAARVALVRKLQELDGAEAREGDLTPLTTVAALAAFWLREKRAEQISANSIKAYSSTVRNQIVPVIGERRLRDCRTSVLDRVIKGRAAFGYDPTMLRKVLHGMFAVAVRHDVMASNPVREVARISRPRREIEYLDLAQIQEVRGLIEASFRKAPPGPRPTNDLRDAVDLILGTGCRIGETRRTHLFRDRSRCREPNTHRLRNDHHRDRERVPSGSRGRSPPPATAPCMCRLSRSRSCSVGGSRIQPTLMARCFRPAEGPGDRSRTGGGCGTRW